VDARHFLIYSHPTPLGLYTFVALSYLHYTLLTVWYNTSENKHGKSAKNEQFSVGNCIVSFDLHVNLTLGRITKSDSYETSKNLRSKPV
jgi:hypothetical protein